MRTPILKTLLFTALAVVLQGGVTGLHAQQTGTVTGRVVDQASMQPLASAQVSIADLSIGVLTQQNGRFILLNVPAGSYTVNVQRIGYEPQSATVTVGADQSANVDFSLSQEALALDEIIVTGTPGGTQRRAVGNVVSRVDAEEVVDRQPAANMQELIGSRAPGLDFVRQNGNVGTGSRIRIRGVSSFNLGTQPLIYVDGIRVDNSTEKGPNLAGRGSASSALDDINPDDIASIEVIKGPAAATLYGTEASAGVVQIITKKGQSGTPQFSFSVTQGTNFMIDPAGKIGDQYYKDADGNLQTFNLYEIEEERGLAPFGYGYNQGYSLGIRGGTDAIRYYLSGDWDDQQGILDYNTNERASIRANVGVLITEGLNLDVSTGFVNGDTRYAQGNETGNVWDQLMWAQGRLLDTPTRGYLTYTPEEYATIEATRDYKRFTGSATVTHTPTDWLTQRLIVGTDYSSDENQILIPRHPDGALGPFNNLSLGDIDVERPLNNEFTFDYSASVNYGLRGVGLTSSVGAQYYTTEYNSVQSHGQVFPSTAIRSIAGATSTATSQEFIQNKSLGVFFQQEAAINDRVYLTAAIRADDNSAFGSEFDAAIYPKFSAAWVVSEEPFFQNQSFINTLRLRSAWGKAGRQPDTFAAVTLFNAAVGPGGAAAVTPGEVGNPEIGPEVSTELEVGFEAAMLDSRIVTDFTYYYQKVRDALGQVPLSPSQGFAGNIDANIAQLDNWGWEASLDLAAIRRQNVALNFGFTGSHSKNKIVDLGPLTPTNDLRVGFPYPVYTSDIITSAEFDEFGQPINVMCDAGTGYLGLEPGGASVPCAETEDYALLLGTLYPQYILGFNPSLTLFQNLELYGSIDSEFGRWGSDTTIYCRHTPCFSNTKDAVLKDDPVYVEGVVYNRRHPTDGPRYIRYDADFVKLREVGARFNIPQSFTSRMGIDRAALSLSGRNLAYLWQRQTHVSGARIPDVEISASDPNGGSALFQWPGLASVTAALRMSF